MQIVNFTYQGKAYTGYIASSTIQQPHFHWLFFSDQSLIDLIGDDCVAFKQTESGTLELFNKISTQHQELVAIAEAHIRNYLVGST